MMTPKDKISKANALLAEAFANLDSRLRAETGRARGAIAQECWRLRQMTGDMRRYFSQSGQDWLVDQVLLKERRDGVFVDVGGYDGVTGSNTLFFETFRSWTGLLIEAVPSLSERAASFRRCPCVGAVLSGDGGAADFLRIDAGFVQMSGRIDTYDTGLLRQVCAHPDHRGKRHVVDTRRLCDVLDDHGISAVDYMSVDLEGAEMDVLESFPFDRIAVKIFSIENAAARHELHALMTVQGYKLVEFLGVDEVYCRPDLVDAP
jgi:hypothetical protein